MPWLSDEIPDWDELTDDEKEECRLIVRQLGMTFPFPEEDDYYE